MSTTPTLRDIADYPAVKKLASALHRLDASRHGAAIMIGAGFSRSAARHVNGEKKMPLWSQFTASLAKELYVNTPDLRFVDPLRVAEEYRAYFGQAALNDRIRFEIENDAWRTGPLYRALLELPWSEILTTNWDTLLEEAATDIHSPYYTPVTKTSDLAWAPSPRIVKLHGTIGVTDSFVVAQEDYRTYPEQFAPFVNLARQVFIENELCLLGFSGDDPNFLQWAGWVRDHLASHARKIYLVGALNLSAARRKQLESINVAPVDLWSAVAHIADQDLRHQKAIELFLQAMDDEEKYRKKPHEWEPTLITGPVDPEDHTRIFTDPKYAASLLTGQLEALRRDRESYPGWLVCPMPLRWRLTRQLSTPTPNPTNLAALTSDDKARVLYELAWRHRITFEYIDPWLADALFEVVALDQPCALSKHQQLEMAVVLLNDARWVRPKSEGEKSSIEARVHVLIGILEKDAAYLPDCIAQIAYYRALIARDRLDYDGLAAVVSGVAGEDPIWKLRRAALLMELGQSEEAAQVIAEAYGELRKNHRRDRQSIPILSRLLWAHWMLQATQRGELGRTPERLPTYVESNYRQWKCDPWSWLNQLRSDIGDRRERYLESQNSIEPRFEQGTYRNRSHDLSLTSKTSEFLLLDGLSATVGIPLHFGRGVVAVDLLGNDAERVLQCGGSSVEIWDFVLAIRASSSEDSVAIKELFTRIGVARASQDVVDTLVSRVQAAVTHWVKERAHGVEGRRENALSRLRVLLEILARLAVRVSVAEAKKLFALAAALGQRVDIRHIWLFDPIGDLLTHSLKSVPEAEQGELLADALSFPLQREVIRGEGPRWPNPVIERPNGRDTYAAVGPRVAQLIDAVGSDERTSRRAALLRLLPLVKADFLTQAEREKLATAIWGETPAYHVLPDTGLFPHALLLLPAIDVGRVEALVRSQLYEHDVDVLEDTQKEQRSWPSPEIERAISIYEGIANAAANEETRLLPAPERAIILFERLTMWRPPAGNKDAIAMVGGARRTLAESIGHALSYAIVPGLPSDAKTASRLGQLVAFHSEVEGAVTVLPALVYFSVANEGSARSIGKILQAALRSQDHMGLGYAAIALQKWMVFPESQSSAEFAKLTSMVIDIIESGRTVGLPRLILLSRELLKAGRLSGEQCGILAEAVSAIFEAADYGKIEPISREAVSVSTIREECVLLACSLLQKFPHRESLMRILDRAKSDPLPEVRFAVRSG